MHQVCVISLTVWNDRISIATYITAYFFTSMLYIFTGTWYVLSAYGGEFCEEDRNGCSEIQCFEGVECLDVPAPGVGAMCGVCPGGYTGDGEKCFGKTRLICVGDSLSCYFLPHN